MATAEKETAAKDAKPLPQWEAGAIHRTERGTVMVEFRPVPGQCQLFDAGVSIRRHMTEGFETWKASSRTYEVLDRLRQQASECRERSAKDKAALAELPGKIREALLAGADTLADLEAQHQTLKQRVASLEERLATIAEETPRFREAAHAEWVAEVATIIRAVREEADKKLKEQFGQLAASLQDGALSMALLLFDSLAALANSQALQPMIPTV